eukprot:TRINITY_DN1568_c0_g1_i1.p1 TRINITY_DN1568_c0_g1~~TRINITY_DN1568_c0_g1_i1.p1  ORF type:complete len:509 (+),score=51.34 TRINITY_DN1568_c0_g1_i1:165-1691(+)
MDDRMIPSLLSTSVDSHLLSRQKTSKARTCSQADIGPGQSPSARRRRCYSFPNKTDGHVEVPDDFSDEAQEGALNSTMIDGSYTSSSSTSSGQDDRANDFVLEDLPGAPETTSHSFPRRISSVHGGDSPKRGITSDPNLFHMPRVPSVRKYMPEVCSSSPAILPSAPLICPPSPKKQPSTSIFSHVNHHRRSASESLGLASYDRYSATGRFESSFKKIRVIGRSKIAQVFECIHLSTNQSFAVKVIANCKSYKDWISRELNAMLAVRDTSHLIRYYDYWEEDNQAHIQMELCRGGSLDKKINTDFRYTESQILTILFQITMGLRHLHELNLAHIDVKPANMFVRLIGDKEEYVLADFNTTVPANIEKVDIDGDGRYLPKELLQWARPIMLQKCDIFSLGASIYEIARGKLLPDRGEEYHALRRGEIAPVIGFSDFFNELIQKMMEPNEEKRITTDYILTRLTEVADGPICNQFSCTLVFKQLQEVKRKERRADLMEIQNNIGHLNIRK